MMAYSSTAGYENVTPSRRVTGDRYRQSRKTGRKPRSPEEWINIPVPAIVDEAFWQQAQVQLDQNALDSPQNNRRNLYLVRGLRCPRCGSNHTGVAQHGKRRYRCVGHDPSISSTGKRCAPGSFLAEPVEQAVWGAVTEAMRGPVVLVEEYEQRLKDASSHDWTGLERKQVGLALKRVKKQEDRVTDAYINEAMELGRYSVEMEKLRDRRSQLERIAKDIERREQQQTDRRAAVEHLEQFCREVWYAAISVTRPSTLPSRIRPLRRMASTFSRHGSMNVTSSPLIAMKPDREPPIAPTPMMPMLVIWLTSQCQGLKGGLLCIESIKVQEERFSVTVEPR